MQRKPGFPIANCSIKMPENGAPTPIEGTHCEDDVEHQQRRQQLINFGHSQWGFNNWSWSVTKQELDFVDFSNGKYCAGVVAFVSVTVKTIDIHRENIGYATSLAGNKGFAIYKSRKCAVTNALRETLLSFGGKVASDLKESLEAARADVANEPAPGPAPEPVLPKPEPKASAPVRIPPRKEPEINARTAHGAPLVANPPPVAKAHPMPAALPPPRPPVPRPPPPPPHLPPAPPQPQLRPNSNQQEAPAPAPAPATPAPASAAPAPSPAAPAPAAYDASEEEARAERKRRQRQAKEEFRQRLKQKSGLDDMQELPKNSTSFDNLLMEIPTQDIVIEETGDYVDHMAKRKSPVPEGNSAKRRASVINRLDIVQTD